ncbi:transporter [Gordonia desulfuricans]|uniref:Transporter n=1 Tax=Gordonia desulfuricans TaxID=89051 RepID=A0A7K3LSS5_9ACTN|nr:MULTISPECIES: TOBE domain-containing protein [Gordonia]KOY49655.1 transporter [Gordonia sp. NB41Y]NDK91335.1 transporter [Gordonia desulfuricans]WLP92310.1 TOBE domain-containing protein [Gordonia sp. NB41Y]
MKLSIRNQLAGEVVSVTLGAVNATVKIRIDGGEQIITSSITKEAAEELGLAEGKRVVALVKASEVSVGVPD